VAPYARVVPYWKKVVALRLGSTVPRSVAPSRPTLRASPVVTPGAAAAAVLAYAANPSTTNPTPSNGFRLMTPPSK